MRAEIRHVVPLSFEMLFEQLFVAKAGVVGTDRDFHMITQQPHPTAPGSAGGFASLILYELLLIQTPGKAGGCHRNNYITRSAAHG